MSSDDENIEDIISDSEEGVTDVVWSLVNNRRKRGRDGGAVASQGLSSPHPKPPPTGKLVID